MYHTFKKYVRVTFFTLNQEEATDDLLCPMCISQIFPPYKYGLATSFFRLINPFHPFPRHCYSFRILVRDLICEGAQSWIFVAAANTCPNLISDVLLQCSRTCFDFRCLLEVGYVKWICEEHVGKNCLGKIRFGKKGIFWTDFPLQIWDSFNKKFEIRRTDFPTQVMHHLCISH